MKKIIMAECLNYDYPLHVGAQNYADLFASNGYEVLWLNPVYSYLTKFYDKNKFIEMENKHNKYLINIKSNLYEYSPKSLFLYGNKPLFNSRLSNNLLLKGTIPNIKSILNKYNFENVDILWISNTKYYDLKNIVNYKSLVHRCSDDISGFKTVCKSMLFFEEKLIKEADKVFVTSKDLIEKKSKIRNDLVYLPNGVELKNFIRNKYTLPSEYKQSDNKKCIFIGALHNWIDVNLIEYCSKKLNYIDFYLIGPADTDLSSLNNISNIHILGKRNYNEIPNYLYYSDVAIIPFKINNLTNSITPVKLYEYMSVGLNVVTTNFKEMQYIDSPAYVAKDYDEFCNYIEQAIENKEKNREQNIKFAKENTWEKRFKIIENYL